MDVFTKKSTSKRIVSFKNIYKIERDMHELSGVKSMFSVNIEVGQHNNEPVNIRTHLVNIDEYGKKPTLVFVHGLGASSSFYWTMWKVLSEKFCIIAFDVIGMGASSRPDDYDFKESKGEDKHTAGETLNYFIGYIEKWREAFSIKLK
jgi:pimeloyl-ACP methyl ester carboxylesterase